MDPDLQRRAQAKAAELGLSFDEYLRRVIVHDLGEPTQRADISLLFDLGASPEPTDIEREKDRMIGEAVWSEHSRKIAAKSDGGTRGRARSRTERS